MKMTADWRQNYLVFCWGWGCLARVGLFDSASIWAASEVDHSQTSSCRFL